MNTIIFKNETFEHFINHHLSTKLYIFLNFKINQSKMINKILKRYKLNHKDIIKVDIKNSDDDILNFLVNKTYPSYMIIESCNISEIGLLLN